MPYEPIKLPDRVQLSEDKAIQKSQIFFEYMCKRHSVRDFSGNPISIKIIENIIATAGRAPSGANQQPWHFVAIKDLNIERARLSPSASINYSKSENKDFSSTIDDTDQETVKATVTWPIIKGGENISSIKKSSFNKQRFQLILQDMKNKITTETSNSWSKYQSSKSVLEATKAQLKAAEIANEGITLEYDSGNTRTTLELIQSRSLLLDARIAFARSERDFVVSQFAVSYTHLTLPTTPYV